MRGNKECTCQDKVGNGWTHPKVQTLPQPSNPCITIIINLKTNAIIYIFYIIIIFWKNVLLVQKYRIVDPLKNVPEMKRRQKQSKM